MLLVRWPGAGLPLSFGGSQFKICMVLDYKPEVFQRVRNKQVHTFWSLFPPSCQCWGAPCCSCPASQLSPFPTDVPNFNLVGGSPSAGTAHRMCARLLQGCRDGCRWRSNYVLPTKSIGVSRGWQSSQHQPSLGWGVIAEGLVVLCKEKMLKKW